MIYSTHKLHPHDFFCTLMVSKKFKKHSSHWQWYSLSFCSRWLKNRVAVARMLLSRFRSASDACWHRTCSPKTVWIASPQKLHVGSESLNIMFLATKKS